MGRRPPVSRTRHPRRHAGYSIPTARNRATADFIVASELFHGEYERIVEDHAAVREAFLRAQAAR